MIDLPANAVRLSSGLTFAFKYVLPSFMLAVTGLFLLGGIIEMLWVPGAHYWATFGGAILPALGCLIWAMQPGLRFIDAVWMCGDALILQNGWQTARVGLTNVKHIEGGSGGYQFSVITLELVQPCPWGNRINFLLPAYYIESGVLVNPVLQQLRSKLYQLSH